MTKNYDQTDTITASRKKQNKSGMKVDFAPDNAFHLELRKRVDEYFARTKKSKHGDSRMYFKTGVILLGFVVSYVLLVFYAQNVWQGVLLSALLGLCTAGIGFNIHTMPVIERTLVLRA